MCLSNRRLKEWHVSEPVLPVQTLNQLLTHLAIPALIPLLEIIRVMYSPERSRVKSTVPKSYWHGTSRKSDSRQLFHIEENLNA